MYTPTQRLTRSQNDRMIAGVAGGIARYLGVDPVFIRLAFVAMVFGGIGFFVYPIFWLIMPEEQGTTTAPRGGVPAEGVTQVFVANRAPRFDPMTGAPLEPEQEIPVQNVGPNGQPAATASNGSRTLGLILMGFGAFLTLKMLLPGLMPLLLPALLIGAGWWLLSRSK
jgi:phage shock protein C